MTADNTLVRSGEDADLEREVLDRYAAGAKQREPELCCPVSYDPELLKLLPREIIEKDYGCGDPSRYVEEGEAVLDLGSGAGKICYILAQKVGPPGRVIGVDFNDAMLAVARKYHDEIAHKLGYRNVTFRKARIQDLALDLEAAENRLRCHPVQSMDELAAFEAHCSELRRTNPCVASDTIDVVVSNCVLNLVRPQDKQRLFGEIFRVLKRGGRAVISDIVCDEEPTEAIKADPKLWSGCISGAFREDQFLAMFEQAGFYGIEIVSRAAEPWQVIDGIEFRSMTVRAFKGKDGPCLERHQAVIYRGSWKQVRDDDGHVFHRGQRMAVCDKTYRLMTNPRGPYAKDLIGVEPRNSVPLAEATPFDCKGTALRAARETKGTEYRKTKIGDKGCCGDGTCC
jgi:arsenite methyltransferase